MRRSAVRSLGTCALLALASATVTAETAAAQTTAQTAATDPLQREIESIRQREQAALARVEALERRLEVLETTAGISTAAPVGDAAQAQMRGRGVGGLQQPAPAPSGAQTAEIEPDRKAPAPVDAVETVTRSAQGFFGRRASIEPGFTYTRFGNASLNLSGFLALDAIFLGLISIDEINSDVFTADVTGRYGITDRLQFDVNVPYIARRTNFQSGGAGGNASGLTEVDVTAQGLGDVSAGASYRVLRETFRRPDVVINARIKAPTGRHPFGIELVEIEGSEGNLNVPTKLSTGTGVWGGAVGVSVLKTIDPMVVFGSLTYFHNFAKDFNDIDERVDDQPGRVKIGNAIQYGLGVAYALNERSSLSMSFTQRIVERTKVRREGEEWQRLVGSQANVGVLNLGATFSLSDRLALLANVGAGLTDDAPDMVVSFRLPYRF